MTGPGRDGAAVDGDSVRAMFASLRRPPDGEGPASALAEFAVAAAVLSLFDPATLRSVDGRTAEGATLRRLLADSVVVPDAHGRACWSLLPGPRERALRAAPDLESLRRARRANDAPKDELQRMLDACILGPALELERLTTGDLEAAIQVVGWLGDGGLAHPLPLLETLRNQLDRQRLLDPLRRLVGAHFRGRRGELDALRAFISAEGGEDAASAPPPMMIWGVGGSGKSTLLARIVLEHATGRTEEFPDGPARPSPFVHLDFDRAVLSPDEPATLLLEAARQLAAQSVESRAECEFLVRELSEDLARVSTSAAFEGLESLSVGSSPSAGTSWMSRLYRFAEIFEGPEYAGLPLLFALDTFEEVQYRTRTWVDQVWNFLSELGRRLPRMRAVVAGRTRVSGREGSSWELPPLDREASIACLEALEVPSEWAGFIHSHTGGNPLALRLAADLFFRERQGLNGLREFMEAELVEKLRDERIQGVLFRRVLAHIHDPRVQKLAHPGLVLRHITPALILEVLAGPCEIEVSSIEEATALWRELSRETALVTQGGADVLKHRPDVRREMIDLLERHRPKQVRAIHEAAVRFYERHGDLPAVRHARAEELYHRLCLDQPVEVLDSRWRSDVEGELRSAIDELPPRAVAYLASRQQAANAAPESSLEAVFIAESFWQDADVVLWERKTVQWVRERLRKGLLDEALREIRSRDERSHDSPLFALEARVLVQMGHWDEALAFIQGALSTGVSDRSARLELLLLLAHVETRTGRPNPSDTLRAARAAVGPDTSRAQRLELLALEVASARRAAASELTALQRSLADELRATPDSILRNQPSLARDCAAQLLGVDHAAAARVARLVGLGGADPAALGSLGARLEGLASGSDGPALAQWSVGQGLPAGSFDLATLPDDAPQVLAEAFARLCEVLRPGNTDAVEAIEVLGALLVGGDTTQYRREAESRADAARLARERERRSLVDALVKALPSIAALERFLVSQLGTSLKSITTHTNLQSASLDVVAWAFAQGRADALREAIDPARNVAARPAPSTPGIVLEPPQIRRLTAALVESFRQPGSLRAMIRDRVGREVASTSVGSAGAGSEVTEVIDAAEAGG